MKLKLQGNSIRLRLTRSEVAQFAERGRLQETVEYGPAADQRLIYGVETADAESVGVQVNRHGISVVIPRRLATEWAGSDRIGISGEVNLADDKRLDVLVEKEFRRMHGCKNDPDLYPNPLETSQ
jgi:hypothetical protein